MTVEKTCTSCHLTKPVSEFSKRNGAKDGLQYWCRDCKREHYEANGVAVREQMRQYYADNADVIKERVRQYRTNNAAAVKERTARKYREGGRPVDKPWSEGPISYEAAHRRVKAIYGAASNYPCSACGQQAHAWSYDHSDPNPLMHQGVGLWADKPSVPYSLDPERYDPMCRSCHGKRDRNRVA